MGNKGRKSDFIITILKEVDEKWFSWAILLLYLRHNIFYAKVKRENIWSNLSNIRVVCQSQPKSFF